MSIDTPRRRRIRVRKAARLTLLLGLVALAGCDVNRLFGIPDEQPENAELKVLFIGNSLTYWFEMPFQLEELLESGGRPARVTDVSQGDTSLDEHLDLPETRLAVSMEDWDAVVLQDGRYEIVLPEGRAGILEDFRKWQEIIRDLSPRARIVMYLDYPLNQDFLVSGVPYSRGEFAALLRESTLIVADSLDLEVAPIGWAWERVLVEHPEYNLYDKDASHPGPLGQYLQASVYYATLLGRSPAGLDYRAFLPGEVALYLQQVAGETVLQERSTWNLPGTLRR